MEIILKTLAFIFLLSSSFIILYQLVFVCASLLKKDEDKNKNKIINTKLNLFAILIPAHNEEVLIGKTIESILNTYYPRYLKDIFVIADNCNDRTAQVVRSKGVECIERFDESQKGKGYALNWALRQIKKNNYNAYVIIDADTLVNKVFFQELNKDINSGKNIIQGFHGSSNPNESWITRLTNISDYLQFNLYFAGRSKLGLSVGLLGNGMCFSREIINKFKWNSFSITEDWEQYLRFISEGYRIHFNININANSQQPVNLQQGKTQKLRWMRGRTQIAKKYIYKILIRAILTGDLIKLDAVINFLLPSITMQMNTLILTSFIINFVFSKKYFFWLLINWFFFLLYLIIGLIKSKPDLKTLLTLIALPIYLVWKIYIKFLSLISINKKDWIRTKRLKL